MIQCLCVCSICCLALNIGLGFGLWAAGVFLRKAESWEVHSKWRQTECKVLVAGVSCVDDETRSTCAGYKVGRMLGVAKYTSFLHCRLLNEKIDIQNYCRSCEPLLMTSDWQRLTIVYFLSGP